jgi:hypothetical protein
MFLALCKNKPEMGFGKSIRTKLQASRTILFRINLHASLVNVRGIRTFVPINNKTCPNPLLVEKNAYPGVIRAMYLTHP